MYRALVSIFLLAPLLYICSVANAEPTRTAQWLMDEPMSLFDWGIYKTDKKLSDLKQAKQSFLNEFFYSAAEYDWSANRIRLKVNFIGKGTEAECIDNIKRAKGAFLNFTWAERDQPRAAKEVFASLFSHEGGYRSKSEPPNIGEQLANMSVLEGTIYVRSEGGSYIPRASCSMDFKSTSVSVVK